tara:strand:+ start:1157 stop:1387 length:231 start_codon:yes stop_codon:yes gene_type:complete
MEDKNTVPLPNLLGEVDPELAKAMRHQTMMLGALGLMKHLAALEGETFTFPENLTDGERTEVNQFALILALGLEEE